MEDLVNLKNPRVTVGLNEESWVVIKFDTGDKYKNRVLCEDLMTRLESGERVIMELSGKFKRKA